jgi:hypothetical protein
MKMASNFSSYVVLIAQPNPAFHRTRAKTARPGEFSR